MWVRNNLGKLGRNVNRLLSQYNTLVLAKSGKDVNRIN